MKSKDTKLKNPDAAPAWDMVCSVPFSSTLCLSSFLCGFVVMFFFFISFSPQAGTHD
jgi:hypothetical protein